MTFFVVDVFTIITDVRGGETGVMVTTDWKYACLSTDVDEEGEMLSRMLRRLSFVPIVGYQ